MQEFLPSNLLVTDCQGTVGSGIPIEHVDHYIDLRALNSFASMADLLQGPLHSPTCPPDFPHRAQRNIHKIFGKKNSSQTALKGSEGQ